MADTKKLIDLTLLGKYDESLKNWVNVNRLGSLGNKSEASGSEEEGNYVAAVPHTVKSYVDDAVLAAKTAATTTVSKADGISVTPTGGTNGQPTDYAVGLNAELKYYAAVANTAAEGEASNAKAAYIAIVDKTDNTKVFGTVNVADIIGNGILDSSSYDQSTGKLTLNFKNSNGTTTAQVVDLAAMLDINDMSIKSDSTDYLSVDLTGAENSQAVFAAKIVKMADAATAAEGVTGKTGLADAADVKDYINAQIKAHKESMDKDAATTDGTNVHVTISQTDGTPSIDSVSEDYAEVTRTEHKDAEGETAEQKAAFAVKSGDEGKLIKASDLAALKSYADDKIGEEEARAKAEIAALGGDKTGTDTNSIVSVEVKTSKGEVSEVIVSVSLASESDVTALFA